MENANADTAIKPPRRRGVLCKFGAMVGLRLLTEASFGFMSPIITILMTEYFARLLRDGSPIDCGANPHDQACIDGSRQAAWLSSLFTALGSVLNFFISPMLGQASDVYGRKLFLVLSQIARVGVPFSVMYFMHPGGSILPFFMLTMIDNGFGTDGVLNAAVADFITPEKRTAAFGMISASIAVGSCLSAFIAPFFPREQILQITTALFVARVLWAVLLVPETLPARTRAHRICWTAENAVSSISILVRSSLFKKLTCLIALTSFVDAGVYQIQLFYLNTVVGLDVTDFGNVMLLGGVVALISQGLLLQPLANCVGEKGVVTISLFGSILMTGTIAGTAFYPHKWLAYLLCVPGGIAGLCFPAISALQSINASTEEQGRLQGAIYGAQSLFGAAGPVIFSALYAAMRRKSVWSHASPFLIATGIYLVCFCVALTLRVGETTPAPKSGKIDRIACVSTAELHADDCILTEPLLESIPTAAYSTLSRCA